MASLFTQATVSELQKLKFYRLTLDEKLAIIKRGRATPELTFNCTGKSHGKIYNRGFALHWYNDKKWLCGCQEKQALFCFPCILFSTGDQDAFTKKGFTAIARLSEKLDLHENSNHHKNSMISYEMIGKAKKITHYISDAHRQSIAAHNSEVKKNLTILSAIIDAVFFCGFAEVGLRGHDESEDSGNPGIFRRVLKYGAKLSPILQEHLDTSTVFRGTSKTTQNEILDCLLKVYREEVVGEVGKAKYVAVLADESTDVSGSLQLVIVLRYVLDTGVKERFWGFFHIKSGKADCIAQAILDQLKNVLGDNLEKLVAQTFDGANVMSGNTSGVQTRVKEVYQHGHFLHCFAHKLNLIMKRGTGFTTSCRIFFSNLSGIATFFSRSPQRLGFLQKQTTNRIPSPSSTRWNFNVRTVIAVHSNIKALRDCFKDIQTSEDSSTESINRATGFLLYLYNDSFLFWLELFSKIMPHVDVLYKQMQARSLSAVKIRDCISSFKTVVNEIRNSSLCVHSSIALTAQAKEVCDYICMDVEENYKFTGHLQATKLFCKENFPTFKKYLPVQIIKDITKEYPFLDEVKLQGDLEVFYSRRELHDFDDLIQLLKVLSDNNLADVLKDLMNLAVLLCTIPITTAEAERCFSTLSRVKSFKRSTMDDDRLNALAALSIESLLIEDNEDIKERVTKMFIYLKDRRMDFIYKK